MDKEQQQPDDQSDAALKDENELAAGDHPVVEEQDKPTQAKERKRRTGHRGKGNSNRHGTASGGMSVERWIFHQGLRPGAAQSFDDYLNILPDRLLQIMTRVELTLFYTVLMEMGGYIVVQNRKRWQQVVKNCNFPQTTSSSYSTRNKYESYLLAKEEHDYMWAAMGNSASMSVNVGVMRLAEICVSHFEQVEGASSKKNLLEPLQEMLANTPEALDAIINYVVDAATDEERTHGLLVLRSMTSRSRQSSLIDALQANDRIEAVLMDFVDKHAENTAKPEDALLAAMMLALRQYDQPEPENAAEICLLLDRMLVDQIRGAYVGRTLVHRITHCPDWVLATLSVTIVAQSTRTAVESAAAQTDLTGLPLSLVRLLTAVLHTAGTGGALADFDSSEIVAAVTWFAKDGPIQDSVRALLAALGEVQPILQSWVCQELKVNSLADVPRDDEDDSSEDRRNMEGKRRIMSSAGLGRKKKGDDDAPKRPRGRPRLDATGDSSNGDAGDGGGRGNDDYKPQSDKEEEELKRMKREKERVRRIRLKKEKEERYRLAAERRERMAVVPAKRPRKPVRLSGSEEMDPEPRKRGRFTRTSGGSSSRGGGGGGGSYMSEAKVEKMQSEFEAERLKLNMQIMSLEAKLMDKEIHAVDSAATSLTLQGNMRFWTGRNDSYSQKQCAMVKEHAQEVLERMTSMEKLAVDAPLFTCVMCNEGPATAFGTVCMCPAYCTDCVDKANGQCRICGTR